MHTSIDRQIDRQTNMPKDWYIDLRIYTYAFYFRQSSACRGISLWFNSFMHKHEYSHERSHVNIIYGRIYIRMFSNTLVSLMQQSNDTLMTWQFLRHCGVFCLQSFRGKDTWRWYVRPRTLWSFLISPSYWFRFSSHHFCSFRAEAFCSRDFSSSCVCVFVCVRVLVYLSLSS
jgi:hypothetical protein